MNYDAFLNQVARSADCQVLCNEPMNKHTTFKIGGNADVFVYVTSCKGLGSVLDACRSHSVPFCIVGNGSDLLIPDEGLRGVVISLAGAFQNLYLLENGQIECAAGVSLARLCSFAHENAFSGLEFAWGIPGSAGGAAYMNAGAYGGEMKNVLLACHHVTREGTEGVLCGDALGLSYRHSAYTENNYIITSLTVQLHKDDPDCIRARMDEYMSRRKEKQPLEYPSAGSVFKRPQGYFAGGLIEQCGLKGKAVGGAMVSRKHAGFIINTGGATCRDVLQLIEQIQNTVLQKTGVFLECEVKVMDTHTLS